MGLCSTEPLQLETCIGDRFQERRNACVRRPGNRIGGGVPGRPGPDDKHGGMRKMSDTTIHWPTGGAKHRREAG